MHPALSFGVGGLWVATSSYRFFMVLAALSTLLLAVIVAARRGLPRRASLACLAVAAMALPVGARLMDAATKPEVYLKEPGRFLALDTAGFSLYGGLLLSAAAGVAACRWLGIDLARMADSVAPALGVGIAIMRIGCFESGCCFGQMTDLPWGVVFPPGSDAHLQQTLGAGGLFPGREPLPVHPTQLYEATAGLVGAALAAVLMSRRAAGGTAFLAGVAWFCAFRLLNHSLRVPGPSLAIPEWFYPALYTVIGSVAALALLWRALSSGSSAWNPRRC